MSIKEQTIGILFTTRREPAKHQTDLAALMRIVRENGGLELVLHAIELKQIRATKRRMWQEAERFERALQEVAKPISRAEMLRLRDEILEVGAKVGIGEGR